MNAQLLFIIIIGILLFNFFLDKLLMYLNSTRWSNELPNELKDFYDADKYQKSQQYEKETTKFSIITSTFSLLLMLLMLFLDGFAWVDTLVRSYTEQPILMTLFFFGCIMFASDILGIPFSLYSTFVIEEKYGFNKTTLKTFVLDKLKGLLLAIIIGGGLISVIVWFYEFTHQYFWLYAWGTLSVFMLFMTMFYASLIVPMFNKLTPLPDGELKDAIVAYCNKVGFKLDNLFVMDGSKRSAKANAFFSGLGAKKKIVLFDTLIEKHTINELVAVLAHEIGHYKKKHTRSAMILSIAQSGLMLYILSLLIDSPLLSQSLGVEKTSFHIGILVFGMLYSPLSMLLGLGMNMLSRKNEFEADNYAKTTHNKEAMQTALKKLSVDNLSNLQPHPAYVFFHYSHPPVLERISALDK